MKQKFYILVAVSAFFIALPLAVWAQSSPLYNSSGSGYSTGGPLNLQQMLQGNKNTATGQGSQYYGEYYGGQNYRPYSVGNPVFGSGLSPQEIAASRAERNARAQQRERENLDALQRYDDELAAFEQQNQLQIQQRANGQQPAAYTPTVGTGTGVRRTYNPKANERFEKPPRVFNSLR